MHYLSWLDHYYERGVKEARTELLTRAHAREMSRYRADGDQHRRLMDEIKMTSGIPKPDWSAR